MCAHRFYKKGGVAGDITTVRQFKSSPRHHNFNLK